MLYGAGGARTGHLSMNLRSTGSRSNRASTRLHLSKVPVETKGPSNTNTVDIFTSRSISAPSGDPRISDAFLRPTRLTFSQSISTRARAQTSAGVGGRTSQGIVDVRASDFLGLSRDTDAAEKEARVDSKFRSERFSFMNFTDFTDYFKDRDSIELKIEEYDQREMLSQSQWVGNSFEETYHLNKLWLARVFGFFLFYLVGVLYFMNTEGWDVLAAVYFVTQTISTVGYGNLSPTKTSGKIFCIFYMYTGILLIFSVVGEFTRYLLVDSLKKGYIKPIKRNKLQIIVRTTVNCFLWLSVLVGIIFFGAVFFFTQEHSLTFVDAFYFSAVTATSVGYGDFIPPERSSTIFNIFYIFVSVALTAIAMDKLASIKQHIDAAEHVQLLEKIDLSMELINAIHVSKLSEEEKIIYYEELALEAEALEEAAALEEGRQRRTYCDDDDGGDAVHAAVSHRHQINPLRFSGSHSHSPKPQAGYPPVVNESSSEGSPSRDGSSSSGLARSGFNASSSSTNSGARYAAVMEPRISSSDYVLHMLLLAGVIDKRKHVDPWRRRFKEFDLDGNHYLETKDVEMYMTAGKKDEMYESMKDREAAETFFGSPKSGIFMRIVHELWMIFLETTRMNDAVRKAMNPVETNMSAAFLSADKKAGSESSSSGRRATVMSVNMRDIDKDTGAPLDTFRRTSTDMESSRSSAATLPTFQDAASPAGSEADGPPFADGGTSNEEASGGQQRQQQRKGIQFRRNDSIIPSYFRRTSSHSAEKKTNGNNGDADGRASAGLGADSGVGVGRGGKAVAGKEVSESNARNPIYSVELQRVPPKQTGAVGEADGRSVPPRAPTLPPLPPLPRAAHSSTTAVASESADRGENHDNADAGASNGVHSGVNRAVVNNCLDRDPSA